MSRVIITTLGTLGDLHPMFPVAETLIKRKHAVLFVVPPALEPRVRNEGFSCLAVEMMPDPPPETFTHKAGESKARINKYYTPFLRSAIKSLTAACTGADVLLSTPHQVAAAVVGDRLGIPWVTLTVFPGMIPSSYTVPQPHWLPALPTPPGRAVNRFTWAAYRYALRYLADDAIEAAVESLGMAANRQLFAPGGLSPHLCLVLSSPVYSPPLPDWPPQVKVVGFAPWDLPRGWVDPPELERFLDSGAAPIVVTTSTAGERDAASFLAIARYALEKLGRRGVLLTGSATQGLLGKAPHAILPSGIAAWPYLPLSRILPRASMIVHHAGIGTGTAAIQHGLPAVAVPASFDQWYNASRIRTLGVGRVIKNDHMTIDRLAHEIELVFTRPRYRARAQDLAQRMKDEDGAARASDEIEALLARRAEPAPA